jgi:hypothetical protein
MDDYQYIGGLLQKKVSNIKTISFVGYAKRKDNLLVKMDLLFSIMGLKLSFFVPYNLMG